MLRRNFLKLMAAGSVMSGAILTGWTAQTANAAAPTSAKITSMPVFAQQHHLSCEYAATRAALARWGIQISEAAFISAIGVNKNPHLGFRGNIDGTWGGTTDYGIYAEPIARFLATKGVNTKLLWNGTSQLKEELAYGRPVVVWIIGSMANGKAVLAQADGVSFKLAANEHAMTLYGYDAGGVYAANPGYGTYEYYSWGAFTTSWSVLGNMAMSVWPSSQSSNAGEGLGIDPAFYAYWLNNSGIELIGQPLTAAFQRNGKLVEYFERARLEWDSSQPIASQISRGLLGRELTTRRQTEPAFSPLSASEVANLSSQDKANFFQITGFYIDTAFADFWQNRGGVAVFGYPISRPFTENNLKVQYFERARLELHGIAILSGLLGQEALKSL